ncbi:polyprenyl synthetase family protein [Campylobacter sp. RM9344]|uniref:Polyprenyl synthetase family protein n=1 Tax=Campylobacter californiensis TaxID=1032243 RepID=A0AAW3ZT67_9BACT|nr:MULTISPECIES: polyprenyl synthetase family protein [unclassified Campylobacter]MBE2985214.1 polyprenyl synthetase family protein [Campylobacter sp. RM6883]MBE2986960.1 polyprenyl synthetase family protein [Campylobacter sp. RM12919]MBE2988605.1 polyprenyl synthetase family protein [Campylobacter sp. RM12920]MBE2995291.1 polyprenyl synthetase family protein [Campylobacter sp. RM6913]MBE3029933.1 polyprenyl synthetase family protein [Campylobacter sp. RM9344]
MSLLDDFINFLNENLPKAPSFHPYYEEALAQMLKAGGKHFRAQLLLGTVNALRPELTQEAMRVALGLEMMHTYSLIHDDLPSMDNAALRRGKPTLHIMYDEVTAILAGDALNTHAFYEISRSNLSPEVRIKCVEILSQNAGANGMVLGQALDCFYENTDKKDIVAAKQRLGLTDKKLSLDELKFLHIHKTAKLIAASLKMAAVIAELSETECEKIYNIGLDLGLAFQIQDDIIDVISDENEAGKPVNNDTDKNSFTNLLGVKGAIESKNELIRRVEEDLRSLKAGIKDVIENLINKHLKG